MSEIGMMGDLVVTCLVILALFLLGYAAIRHRTLLQTVEEIRDIVKGKAEEVTENIGVYK